MIYDYRQDLITLIKHTENNDQSLIQTLYSLQIISTALLNGQYLQHPEKLFPNHLKPDTKENKTEKEIPTVKNKDTGDNKTFSTTGELIHYLRTKHQLTQKQLSTKLGIAISGVSNLEHNHRKCSDQIKNKLCQIFDLTTNQFDKYLQKNNGHTIKSSENKLTNNTKSDTKPNSSSASPIHYIKKVDKPEIHISDTYVSDATLVKVATQQHTLGAHQYVARRNLNNVSLLDMHGKQVDILNEAQIHQDDITSGDIVTAVYRYGQYECQHVLHQHLNLKALQIDELQYGKVKEDDHGNLFIDEDAYGNSIQTYDPKLNTYKISNRIANAFNILNGSLVDLAWYHQDPDTVKIRWVHPLNEDKPLKRVTKYNNKNYQKSKTTESQDFEPDLDYDLKGQTVNIIIGDNVREKEINDLIKAHNGIPEVTDAFIHQDVNKTLEDALTQADIAIMVQNLNKHSTSKALSLIVKSQKLKFAISNSAGLQSIERAIYRADCGLPAYEPTGYQINYPIKTA